MKTIRQLQDELKETKRELAEARWQIEYLKKLCAGLPTDPFKAAVRPVETPQHPSPLKTPPMPVASESGLQGS